MLPPTQRLDVVLIKTSFDVLDHETRLANLRVAHHPHLDHHAAGKVSAKIRMSKKALGISPILFVTRSLAIVFGSDILTISGRR